MLNMKRWQFWCSKGAAVMPFRVHIEFHVHRRIIWCSPTARFTLFTSAEWSLSLTKNLTWKFNADIYLIHKQPTYAWLFIQRRACVCGWIGPKVAFPNKQKFIAVLTNDTLTLIMSYDMLQATITYICELLIHLLIIYSQSARYIRLRTFFPKKILLECISPVKESDCSEPFISWTLDILNENLDFPNFSSKHRELTHVISKK